MKYRVNHIDWDIGDEDLMENFGSTTDDNGLPYTAKDLGLPAWDEEEVVECDSEEEIADAISDEHGWLVNGFNLLGVSE